MKPDSSDSAQTMQRVRVGVTGLAVVLVIMALASVVYGFANRDQPISAVGASNALVVANMTDGNSTAAKERDEPLAELGVAPSTASTGTPHAGKHQEAPAQH